MKAMGIDIGTTTISGVVLDVEKKQVVETRTIPNGSFLPTRKDWERMQDVSVILKKARALVDELLDCCPEYGLRKNRSAPEDQQPHVPCGTFICHLPGRSSLRGRCQQCIKMNPNTKL